jgi:hypothetical protein
MRQPAGGVRLTLYRGQRAHQAICPDAGIVMLTNRSVAYNGKGQGLLRCIELKSGNMIWTDETWTGGSKPLMFANGFITPNEDICVDLKK